MADGLNNARSMRILEIVNDFRTLQQHINSHAAQPSSNPASPALQALAGYQLIQHCRAEAQRLFPPQQTPPVPNAGNLEEQKRQLQTIIRDAYTRRFRAHRIYLRIACAIRWIKLREQVSSTAPNARQALQAIDQRLRQEMAAITDQHVYAELRRADQRNNYMIADDPTLEQVIALARTQQ